MIDCYIQNVNLLLGWLVNVFTEHIWGKVMRKTLVFALMLMLVTSAASAALG